MKRIDSFNASDNLVEMYVYYISYRKASKSNNNWFRKFTIESTPFYHYEVCEGAMFSNVSELKAKGYEVTCYYVTKAMISETEKQF